MSFEYKITCHPNDLGWEVISAPRWQFLKTAVAYMNLNQLLTTAGKKKSLKRLLNKYFFILLLAFYRYKAYSML